MNCCCFYVPVTIISMSEQYAKYEYHEVHLWCIQNTELSTRLPKLANTLYIYTIYIPWIGLSYCYQHTNYHKVQSWIETNLLISTFNTHKLRLLNLHTRDSSSRMTFNSLCDSPITITCFVIRQRLAINY